VGTVAPIQRLGVPALRLQDASGGFRPTGPDEYGTVTSWPSMLTLAASWDETMVERVAAAIAREFKGKGANVLLGPGLNVHRTPYGGRNWEYLSGEDPYLGARLAPVYVQSVQNEGVMAVIKHFAFNEQETERNSEDSVVSERVAWELYYPPFEAAIKAGAGAVMCSYNKVDSGYACGNPTLLRDDLKGRMGFSGFVMSDWGAVHGTNAIEGGMDMEQPSANFFQPGKLNDVDSDAVRDAARRVLASIYHLRIDENPGCELPCAKERSTNQRTATHLQLAEDAAAAGVVLLQNKGVLPLDPNRVKTLAVLGAAATAQDTQNTWGPGSPYSGGGSGHVPAPHVVTPLQGIRERAKQAGISVVTEHTHMEHLSRKPTATEAASRRLRGAAKAVEDADVVVVVGATTATESADRFNLALDDGADALIAQVSKTKTTVVLLEVPGAVLTPWRDQTAAIACLFIGGERTGSAWASVLFGDVVPAGKLPITFPASLVGTLRPEHNTVAYEEGLLTSYRSPSLRAAFPFGHGLSYTTFVYSEPRFVDSNCGARICVSVLISNSGHARGAEVVQAYLSFSSVPGTPELVLRGFKKTSWMNPGDMEEVTFGFTDRDLSTYDDQKHGWKQQPNCRIAVHIGASSADVRHVLPFSKTECSTDPEDVEVVPAPKEAKEKEDGFFSGWFVR